MLLDALRDFRWSLSRLLAWLRRRRQRGRRRWLLIIQRNQWRQLHSASCGAPHSLLVWRLLLPLRLLLSRRRRLLLPPMHILLLTHDTV